MHRKIKHFQSGAGIEELTVGPKDFHGVSKVNERHNDKVVLPWEELHRLCLWAS